MICEGENIIIAKIGCKKIGCKKKVEAMHTYRITTTNKGKSVLTSMEEANLWKINFHECKCTSYDVVEVRFDSLLELSGPWYCITLCKSNCQEWRLSLPQVMSYINILMYPHCSPTPCKAIECTVRATAIMAITLRTETLH